MGKNSGGDESANKTDVNSTIQTILVGDADDRMAGSTRYHETGSNVIVSTTMEGQPSDGVTGWMAASNVGGALGLMREANYQLTWKEVSEIFAYSSRKISLTETNPDLAYVEAGTTNWNGGGNLHSQAYGYGALDISAAVHMAENWHWAPTDRTSGVSASSSATINGVQPTDGSGYSSYIINFSNNDSLVIGMELYVG